jgi:hypothetical protein
MSHPTEHRDEVVGDAVASLSQGEPSEDFFDRLAGALDEVDASRTRRRRGWRLRRGGGLGIAVALACFLVGGVAGAAVQDHRTSSPPPQGGQGRSPSANSYAVAYSVINGRQIAAIHATDERPSADLGTSSFGLTIPSDWDGRVLFSNQPGVMPVIQAANFTLPADDSTDGSGPIQDQMGPGDVFIWIGNYGTAPAWMFSSPLWQQTTPPISVSANDAGHYDGQSVPLFLLRHVIVHHQALLVGVEFGTATPGDSAYAQVNHILSTLTLADGD